MGKELVSLFEGNNEEIETDLLVIKNNVLRFDRVSVQLSNISRVHTGEIKPNLSLPMVFVFIVSLFLFKNWTLLGFIGLAVSGFHFYKFYQEYVNKKQYLTLSLNSGQFYSILFDDKEFIEKARSAIENAFNKSTDATINIAENKIINGDNHSHNAYGDFANINSGTQKDNDINSHNSDSFNVKEDHSSTTIGDINNSAIHSSSIGSNIKQKLDANGEYDWNSIQVELKKVISSIKIDSPVKEASKEALVAAKDEDKAAFESIVKHHKKEFLSDLFANTASGLLVQVVSVILGII
ncbi:hypothetical protein NRIC_05870 [Enterococcus florum]|uniref:Uncharacterized protein n=1 Tax=Enterococcus florum TaxID=2480627 RepID=A0A4P5P5I1_9ENTE|nr:DUF6232 family protein [Enterococcus florum]GCF92696.1 hypothetical protein NRIC_05870 [Enterococcus florum]